MSAADDEHMQHTTMREAREAEQCALRLLRAASDNLGAHNDTATVLAQMAQTYATLATSLRLRDIADSARIRGS